MYSILRNYLLPAIVIAATWAQTGETDYERGRSALERSDWQGAVEAFEAVSSGDGLEDAALYWRAYAHNKLGDTDRAIDLATSLPERFPDSRWRDDARALIIEIRGSAGDSGTRDADEELKIMALNALVNSDAEDALPVLEEFLTGDHPMRLKGRALFVLAQMGSDESYAALADIARNGSEPELQRRAIRYLGVHHSERSLALLAELYGSLEDLDSRRAVLQSFMVADEEARLLEVAQNEPNEDLRGRAIRLLGAMNASDELARLYEQERSEPVRKKILEAFMVSGDESRLLLVARNRAESVELRKSAIRLLGAQGANDELWTLYGEETNEEIRERILHGLFIAGDVDRIEGVARDASASEELRKVAIHNLGISGDTAARLMDIYDAESSAELKRQVLHGLFLQDAVTELIAVGRTEDDVELKKQAVHWLSLMDTPEAKEFLMEILRR